MKAASPLPFAKYKLRAAEEHAFEMEETAEIIWSNSSQVSLRCHHTQTTPPFHTVMRGRKSGLTLVHLQRNTPQSNELSPHPLVPILVPSANTP